MYKTARTIAADGIIMTKGNLGHISVPLCTLFVANEGGSILTAPAPIPRRRQGRPPVLRRAPTASAPARPGAARGRDGALTAGVHLVRVLRKELLATLAHALPQVGEEIGEQRQRAGLTLHVLVVSGRGAGLVGAIHIFIPSA